MKVEEEEEEIESTKLDAVEIDGLVSSRPLSTLLATQLCRCGLLRDPVPLVATRWRAGEAGMP